MNFTSIIFGVIFCVAGIVFASGKVHIHLSAWKAMPEEEKKKIRIMLLCRNIGEVIALDGVVFLLNGLWPGFSQHWFVCAVAAWIVIAGVDIWYIGKSKHYRNQ